MKLFQSEILFCASVYVLAETEEEARAKVSAMQDNQAVIEFSDRRQQIADDIWMTGETYGPDMPELSLAPVMTAQRSATRPNVYETEDFGETEETDA